MRCSVLRCEYSYGGGIAVPWETCRPSHPNGRNESPQRDLALGASVISAIATHGNTTVSAEHCLLRRSMCSRSGGRPELEAEASSDPKLRQMRLPYLHFMPYQIVRDIIFRSRSLRRLSSGLLAPGFAEPCLTPVQQD